MQDFRRQRYHVFFYSNSTSFAVSIILILFLLQQWLQKDPWTNRSRWHGRVMNIIIELSLFTLLLAYVAGSTRDHKTIVHISLMVAPIPAYYALHLMLYFLIARRHRSRLVAT
jgi:hypothetical protein